METRGPIGRVEVGTLVELISLATAIRAAAISSLVDLVILSYALQLSALNFIKVSSRMLAALRSNVALNSRPTQRARVAFSR